MINALVDGDVETLDSFYLDKILFFCLEHFIYNLISLDGGGDKGDWWVSGSPNRAEIASKD
jgi:hypothetical protein